MNYLVLAQCIAVCLSGSVSRFDMLSQVAAGGKLYAVDIQLFFCVRAPVMFACALPFPLGSNVKCFQD